MNTAKAWIALVGLGIAFLVAFSIIALTRYHGAGQACEKAGGVWLSGAHHYCINRSVVIEP